MGVSSKTNIKIKIFWAIEIIGLVDLHKPHLALELSCSASLI